MPADEAAAAGGEAAGDGQQQQAGDGYDIEAMTFVAEEEVIPLLAAVRAAEEAAAAAADSGKSKKVRKATSCIRQHVLPMHEQLHACCHRAEPASHVCVAATCCRLALRSHRLLPLLLLLLKCSGCTC